MKLVIKKELINGQFNLHLSIADINAEERDRLIKFGSPSISIAPRFTIHQLKYADAIPLHEINDSFSFNNEKEAMVFLDLVKNRVSKAITDLKSKEDKFTNREEYEF